VPPSRRREGPPLDPHAHDPFYAGPTATYKGAYDAWEAGGRKGAKPYNPPLFDPHEPGDWLALGGMGAVGGAALGGLGGGGAAGSSAASGLTTTPIANIPFSAAPYINALPTSLGSGAAATAGGAGAASMGFDIGKFLGKLDPTALALGGLSMLGGDDEGGQKLNSYANNTPGNLIDPKLNLQMLMNAIYRLGAGLEQSGPTKLRSSYVPGPPSPISIPGLGFQIGGGLGRDPALGDPSLLELGNTFREFQPFQGVAQNQFNPTPPAAATTGSRPSSGGIGGMIQRARRRSPQ